MPVSLCRKMRYRKADDDNGHGSVDVRRLRRRTSTEPWVIGFLLIYYLPQTLDTPPEKYARLGALPPNPHRNQDPAIQQPESSIQKPDSLSAEGPTDPKTPVDDPVVRDDPDTGAAVQIF